MKKNTTSLLLGLLILGCFAALVFIFAKGLGKDPTELDLNTKGQKVAAFKLPDLFSDQIYTEKDLTSDKGYFLINIWGTWCPACIEEHPFLYQLSQTETIYGVNWKDDNQSAINFLNTHKNPYHKVIVDKNSDIAINLGVYGAPETFLIQSDGTILYRHIGVLTQETWEKEFIPLIQKIKL